MKYFLIAGEASGDMHGAALMRELRAIDPQAQFCFLGGDLMQHEGGNMIRHYRDMAFMGVVNVILNLHKIAKNFDLCAKAIKDFSPDAVILIDYPGFNLKVAKYVKNNLDIPVYYYIAPKLWAWKEYRIKSIKRYVDRMFTIFPFETEYFGKLGYNVEYVGNPTAEAIDNFLNNNATPSETDKSTTIALLCGSRRQEVLKCLPIMARMTGYFPQYKFIVAAAPNIDHSIYTRILRGNTDVVYGDTYNVLRKAQAAIVNSGTATLETAIIGTPQVVVYHVIGGLFVPLLRKIFIKIPFVSLVNLIAGKELVTELITPKFTERQLYIELNKIVSSPKRYQEIKEGYWKVTQRLGKESASKNTARLIYGYLESDRRLNKVKQ